MYNSVALDLERTQSGEKVVGNKGWGPRSQPMRFECVTPEIIIETCSMKNKPFLVFDSNIKWSQRECTVKGG